jgi:hypothetical protein
MSLKKLASILGSIAALSLALSPGVFAEEGEGMEEAPPVDTAPPTDEGGGEKSETPPTETAPPGDEGGGSEGGSSESD